MTKKINYRSIATTVFSIAFVLVLSLSMAQDVAAQRYLTELRPTQEVKGLSQFAANLGEFLKLAESLEGVKIVSPRDFALLEAAGKKVKDGAPNFRQSLDGLIARIKKNNRWDEALEVEILSLLGNRKIKGFFQNNGGARRVLTEALNAYNVIPGEVDQIINSFRNSQSVNSDGEAFYTKASFAASVRKVRFKCIVLGAAVFGAELAGADRTAENLDKIFDKNCGAGASTAT